MTIKIKISFLIPLKLKNKQTNTFVFFNQTTPLNFIFSLEYYEKKKETNEKNVTKTNPFYSLEINSLDFLFFSVTVSCFLCLSIQQ